jgi:hypothetical protein
LGSIGRLQAGDGEEALAAAREQLPDLIVEALNVLFEQEAVGHQFPGGNSNPTVRDRLMRRAEAARYVTDTYFPCSPKTLAKLACVSSTGPPFRKAGRIPLYPKSGLDAWARNKIGPLVRSTSDPTSEVA